MQPNSKLIRDEDKIEIWDIGRERQHEVTSFIYSTYFSRFQKYDTLGIHDLIKMTLDDTLTGPNSKIFLALSKTSGLPLGSIRVIEKVGQLPAERDFNFEAISEITKNFPHTRKINRIYEIGRFATNVGNLTASGLSRADSFFITDCLLREMILYTSANIHNVLVAAIDITTHRIVGMRGLNFRKVSEVNSDYVGSPTVAVILPIKTLIKEISENKVKMYNFYFQQKSHT